MIKFRSMSMNLNREDELLKEFEDVFTFRSKEEEIDHERQMIVFRFLSEVERVYIEQTGERKLNKNKLAEKIGKTPSFVTQLFNGNKNLNFETLAKFQKALDVKFEIKARESFEASAIFNNDYIDSYRQKYHSNGEFWVFRNLRNEEKNRIGKLTSNNHSNIPQAV